LDKQRVLILDGDSRQGLPFVRSLRKAGNMVTVVCPWKACPCYFSRYPNKRLIWPDINEDSGRYYDRLLEYVKGDNCDVVLALGDVTAILVSENKDELTKYVKTPVPDYEILRRAADKSWTMDFCMRHRIPCPKTYDPSKQSIEDIVKETAFPVIVKPVRGVGAVGLHKFETAEQLKKSYDVLEKKHGKLQIQEFIPQYDTQFQAEAFCDQNSQMKVCMVIGKPRFFPVTGGTSTCNTTIERADIVEIVRKLLEGIKWTGSADVDLIFDPRDKTPKVLEINPRVTAGIKIGFDAGIDYADLQMRLALGLDIPEINQYQVGKTLRNLCLDILWYMYSSREARENTSPPWWKFFGKNVHYQTFRRDDPLPFLGFLLSNMKKFTKSGTWKTKLGKDVK